MKRKDFFKNTAFVAAAATLPASKIFAEGYDRVIDENSGVKITKVTPYLFKSALFIKVETDAGVSGWGECDSSTRKLAAKAVEYDLAKHVIGEDPFESEYLWHKMYFKEFDMGRSGILTGTMSGIDNALWDLKGKLLGKPVHKLLGSANKEKVAVYGSYGRSKGNRYLSPDEMAAIGVDFVSKGYKAIKPRMQIRQLGLNPDPDPTFDVIKAVRKAVGDDIKIYVDFNNGYTAARAIMVSKKIIEHFNVEVIEEPVTQQSYSELKQVVDTLDVPVSAGEHEYQKWKMRDLITQANVDYVNADVIKCGGITECKKVAGLAHAFDKLIMTHNARPTLATAANLQYLGSVVNAAKFQEYGGSRERLGQQKLFKNYFRYEDGYLYIPQEPGLGLVPDEKMMEKEKIN